MDPETQVFAGLPVRDLSTALGWYTELFGRTPEEVVGDEAMWQVTQTTWLFVASDQQRAGGALITLAVASLDPYLSRWHAAGLEHQPIETYSNGVQHVTIVDPDGNSISLASSPTPDDDEHHPA